MLDFNVTPISILIVDDTPANLNVLATMLTQSGYKVRPANNGEVALTVAQNALPDLILLDIQMPNITGYEVCKRLKTDEATRHIPVIFISALDDVLDKVGAFEVGGADYITKPFQVLEVLARVENQVDLLRQRKQIINLRAAIKRLPDVVESLTHQIDSLAAQHELTGLLTTLQELRAQVYELEQQAK